MKPLILRLLEHVNSFGNFFPIVRVHISIKECGAPSLQERNGHCFISAASGAETAALDGLQLKVAKRGASLSENSGLSDPF